MAETRTEALHQNAEGLDIQAPDAILSSLANAQIEAAKAVRGAIPAIAKAAEIIAGRLNGGGKLAYAAAGSSGLMALADALELPGTFGIQRDRIAILIAGGDEAFKTLAGGPEDDTDEAAAAVANAGIGKGDCLIAISASGSTPYAVRAHRGSRAPRCRHHRHRQQQGRAAAPAGRRRHPARNAAGADRRLDAHGRRHRPEDRAQHAVDADRHPSRPCA